MGTHGRILVRDSGEDPEIIRLHAFSDGHIEEALRYISLLPIALRSMGRLGFAGGNWDFLNGLSIQALRDTCNDVPAAYRTVLEEADNYNLYTTTVSTVAGWIVACRPGTWLPETEESYKVAANPGIIVEIVNHSWISIWLDESEQDEDSKNYFKAVINDIQKYKSALDECDAVGWKIEDNSISYNPLKVMTALSLQDTINGVMSNKINRLYISE